jgi:hypothetical protein
LCRWRGLGIASPTGGKIEGKIGYRRLEVGKEFDEACGISEVYEGWNLIEIEMNLFRIGQSPLENLLNLVRIKVIVSRSMNI